MTRPAQKALEKLQLALVRKICPELLPDDAEVRDGLSEEEEPDLMVSLPCGKRLGIEVTTIRDCRPMHGHKPSVIEAARETIIQNALKHYGQLDGAPVCVNAYIGPGPYDIKQVSTFVAQVAHEHAKDGKRISVWPSDGAPIELHASVWKCEPSEITWRLGAVEETKVMLIEELQATVNKKAELVASSPRRGSCDVLWLLIVSTSFPPSCDFVFPEESANWRLDRSVFDRVVVFSQSDGKLLSFGA